MHRRLPPDPERGLSLVELMFAMSVLTIGTLALLATMLAAQVDSAALRERRIATEAARGLVEEIVAAPFPEVRARYDKKTWPVGDLVPAPGGAAPMQAFVAPVKRADGTDDPRLLEAIVDVSWRGVRGAESFALRTLVAERRP
jgi:Tfp pilus assembly protein PilV